MNSFLAVVAAADPSLITVGGLPLHPLAVHAVVVLLPLSAIGLMAIILKPAWRTAYGWLVMAGLLAGVGATIVAVQAGEQLALITGITEEHRRDGKLLQFEALALLAFAGWWFWQQHVQQRGAKRRKGSPASASSPLGKGPEAVAAIASLVLSAGALVLAALVGHSGATAVWTSKIAPAPTPSATTTATSAGYTMSKVKEHATSSDCWSAIDGKVYDLTDWVTRHPGGPTVIESICGIDGSAAFAGQHSGQSRPAGYLAGYEIGKLSDSSSNAARTAKPVNSLTLAGVQSHNTAANCWTIINGNIYNVTSWIDRHPGGAGVIQGMCGIDGSAAFANQHGNQGEPNQVLSSFLLGPVKG